MTERMSEGARSEGPALVARFVVPLVREGISARVRTSPAAVTWATRSSTARRALRLPVGPGAAPQRSG